MEISRELLTGAISLADNAEIVPIWWIAKLARSLVNDLWAHSLHENLPIQPPEGGATNYSGLRQLFIASLYSRKNAEVELWPSQREAAKRSADVTDDLVVALPTSAGKTRVAEIAALMTLASGRRVLIVTPLRALSAQTERSFRRTFAPLGFTSPHSTEQAGFHPATKMRCVLARSSSQPLRSSTSHCVMILLLSTMWD